jgi:cysteine desulfurase
MRKIYLDNAATTALSPKVLEAMMPYLTTVYGNPSSVHAFGQEAKKGLDAARDQVAAALNCTPGEVIFTGCGTESDNTAILGVAEKYKNKGKHIITSIVEHHAVLHTCQWLEKQGFEVTYLPVDEYGRVTAEQVEKAITDQTILITIMAANNEIGTLMPIAQIAQVAHQHKVLFHTDAVQAMGAVPIDVVAWGVDLLSLSAHKFHGPKGVGLLYVRKGTRIDNLVHGGAQERGKRAGTENLPAIVGMGEAMMIAARNQPENARRLSAMRDRMIAGLLEKIPHSRLNGHPTERLPGNVNVSIRYIEGEAMLLRLDMAGIAASSGSACTSGSLDPSHVLLAIGLPHEIAHGSLRFSLSDESVDADVDEVLNVLPGIVKTLRDMSPIYPGNEG